MYGGDKTRNPLGKTATFFWLVVVASLCRALYGIVSKAGLSAHAEPQPMLLLVACCWIIGGAFYAAVIEKRFVITRKKIVYSLLSGSMVFCIVNFLMLGLADEQASVVIPIANMSFVVALFISSVLKLEKLNGRKFMAACCAMVSIFLLANV
jgi:drug/metabolite transporter (DMT)-like permease